MSGISTNQIVPINWADPYINFLGELDKKIDESFPQNILQTKIDSLASQIKQKFSPCEGFELWDHATEWYTQLATYLVKLPPKAAWNVVTALYNIISQALYMAVHPVKGLNCLAKDIIFLLNELAKPETWAKMGAGSIGMLTAQGMILGGPISLIGLGIGGALMAGGIFADTVPLLLAVGPEGKGLNLLFDKIKVYAKELPESLLTGVFMGLLIGGIRRAFASPKTQPLDELRPSFPPTFEKISDVAEYKWADWKNLVKIERGITLEQAKLIASRSADIDYFFFTKGGQMVLEDPNWKNFKIFHHGDVAFFSGKPWWGSAPGLADGYFKA